MMLLLLTTRTLSLYSNKIRYSSLLLKPSSLLLKSSTSLLASSTSLSTTKVVGDVTVDVNLLQNLVLNDANGNKKKLGTVMGKDKSVVIFLRHLGKNSHHYHIIIFNRIHIHNNNNYYY